MPLRPITEVIQNQRLVYTQSSATVSEAAILMKAEKVGALLVLEHKRLVGIFTERDALFRVLATGIDADRTSLDQVMTPSPQTINADRPFGHALHMMYEGGFRHVPVIDHGKLVGMVSSRDALSAELVQFESDVREREHIAEILG